MRDFQPVEPFAHPFFFYLDISSKATIAKLPKDGKSLFQFVPHINCLDNPNPFSTLVQGGNSSFMCPAELCQLSKWCILTFVISFSTHFTTSHSISTSRNFVLEFQDEVQLKAATRDSINTRHFNQVLIDSPIFDSKINCLISFFFSVKETNQIIVVSSLEFSSEVEVQLRAPEPWKRLPLPCMYHVFPTFCSILVVF